MKEEKGHRIKEIFTFANGASGAALTQERVLTFNGEIIQIHQRNSSNTGTRTAQLILLDEDGYQMWDGTAKVHNANHDFEFGVTIRRLLTGKDTLRCVLSGDPGVSGAEITVVIRPYGRDG
jgi:hypothetical protein